VVIYEWKGYYDLLRKGDITAFYCWFIIIIDWSIIMSKFNRFLSNGVHVKGNYGRFEVSGIITDSHISGYGKSAAILYHVLLDKPIQLRWRTEPTTTALLSDNDIKVALV
jgi:hypothetical protein